MKICILSEKRTGSSYFCELLNGTRVFEEPFKEWFVKFDKRKNVIDFYKNSKGVFFNKFDFIFPNNCKIHWTTAKFMFGEDFNIFFKNTINSKFIIIQRNEIDMTISQMIANKTDFYEIRSEHALKDWLSKKIDYNKKDLIKCYNYIKKIKNKWKEELNKRQLLYYTINYEKIIQDTKTEIKNLLNYLNVKVNENNLEFAINYANKSIIKQDHPIKSFLIKKLKNMIKIC